MGRIGRIRSSRGDIALAPNEARRATGLDITSQGVRPRAGDLDDARALEAEAREIVEPCPSPGALVDLLDNGTTFTQTA